MIGPPWHISPSDTVDSELQSSFDRWATEIMVLCARYCIGRSRYGEGKSALNTYSLTSVGSCVVSILKEQ